MSLGQHSLPPARYQPHPLSPSIQTINQEETKSSGKESYFQKIISYRFGARTQNIALRKIDLESRPKICSVKINRLRTRRKNPTENKSYRTAGTHKRESST